MVHPCLKNIETTRGHPWWPLFLLKYCGLYELEYVPSSYRQFVNSQAVRLRDLGDFLASHAYKNSEHIRVHIESDLYSQYGS